MGIPPGTVKMVRGFAGDGTPGLIRITMK